ncbi:MAG: hypothetical protein U9Q66_01320 [Patescibacteria group bacterium]|nr:hypothetical protein [Patescibacteria group bacterium]
MSEGKSRDIKIIEKNITDNYDSLAFHEKWILSRIRHLSDVVTKSMIDNSFSD